MSVELAGVNDSLDSVASDVVVLEESSAKTVVVTGKVLASPAPVVDDLEVLSGGWEKGAAEVVAMSNVVLTSSSLSTIGSVDVNTTLDFCGRPPAPHSLSLSSPSSFAASIAWTLPRTLTSSFENAIEASTAWLRGTLPCPLEVKI